MELASKSGDLSAADRSEDASDAGRIRWLPPLLFVLIAGVMLIDVGLDARSGADATHLGLELLVVVGSLSGAVLMMLELRAARSRASALGHQLIQVNSEAARFRQEAQLHLRGLSEAIDRQFGLWALTASEREIGFLLLKGLALKEIAEARGTSERTVRHQALNLYKKAGVGGRAELSAFFLEDLLAPAGSG